MKPRVFIGYDARESVAFYVLSHSIEERASVPVAITPLRLDQLKGVFDRPRSPVQSTDFAFSRFLTPYLAGYEGWALFMDCDMLLRADIAELWALREERYAVMVVKHDYVPKDEVKFLGQTQTRYPKKNWSSVMLFNCARCKALTPEYVTGASGLELHQFKWLADEAQIGPLPRRWNHLVGEYGYDPHAANVHFTVGGPYFQQYARCDYAAEWFAARDRMMRCDQRERATAAKP